MLLTSIQVATADSAAAVGPAILGSRALSAWVEAYPLIAVAIGLAVLALVAWIANEIARRYILRVVRKLILRTHVTWDDQLLAHDVFRRLANVVPAIVAYYGVLLVPGLPDTVVELVQRVALAVAVIVVVLSISALLNAGNEIYGQRPEAVNRPIKGYLQIVKIFLYIVAIIVVVSQLVGQSPVVFLSGIGALTAIILLIFRDTILSFVASIQLSMNDMVRLGDWIEMPKYGADGDVIDIALHTVKIQNWDKTITTVPTHALISDSFKNWRGMSDSGGRRIKRSINIDMNSVGFLEPDDIGRLARWELLAEYIARKLEAIEEYNAGKALPSELVPHVRRLTNLGTFRAYVVNYLRSHPHIHKGMTLLVRQLDPTPHGIPLQLYVFSDDTAWVSYEGIQSDIFEHLLAVLPEFGLRVFQAPAGSDVQALMQPTPTTAVDRS
jgi:miniconductance mechanosensitive channel